MASRGPFKRSLQMVVKTTTENNRKKGKLTSVHWPWFCTMRMTQGSDLLSVSRSNRVLQETRSSTLDTQAAGPAMPATGDVASCESLILTERWVWRVGWRWETGWSLKASVWLKQDSPEQGVCYLMWPCCFCVKQKMWDVLKHICQFDLKFFTERRLIRFGEEWAAGSGSDIKGSYGML